MTCWVAAAVICLSGCSLMIAAPEVRVESGSLLGGVEQGVYSFKGVPYAAAPVGELRWRPPQPALAWDGQRRATEYLPHCAQPLSEAVQFDQRPMSEDCLAVNVWTPDMQPAGALPVMVWIHGGGFVTGSGNLARTNSPRMAAQGVVLVTVNYRLSVFGFLAHPALSASHPDEVAANYGLQDTIAALQWVQRNIAEFGGDPGNVTIFGESAGANMVNLLLVTPPAAGLFHKAIAQSASTGLSPEAYPDRRSGFQPPAYREAEKFAGKLQIDVDANAATVAVALRSASTADVLDVITDQDRYTPLIDGELLPNHVGVLLREGQQHKVPYMFGGNSWEASLGRNIGGGFSPEFSARLLTDQQKQELYPGLSGAALEDAIFGDLIIHSGNDYVGRQMDALGTPVYRYYLSYLASDRRERQPGVAHADDIAFVMQTVETEADIGAVSTEDRRVSQLMSRYWVQFAYTGNPNRSGSDLQWAAYTADAPAVLEIGDKLRMREALFPERLQFHRQRGAELLERASR